jgi:hypothetical protein
MSEIVIEDKSAKKRQSKKNISTKSEVVAETEKRIIYLESELPGIPEIIDAYSGDLYKEEMLELANPPSHSIEVRGEFNSNLDSRIPEAKNKKTLQERFYDKKIATLIKVSNWVTKLYAIERPFFTRIVFTRIGGEEENFITDEYFQEKVSSLSKFSRKKLMKNNKISEDELNFLTFGRFKYPFIMKGEKEWSKLEKNARSFIDKDWISEDIKGNFKINVGKIYSYRETIIFPTQYKEVIFQKISHTKPVFNFLKKIQKKAQREIKIYNLAQIKKLPFSQFLNANNQQVSENDARVSKLIKKKPIELVKKIRKK